MPKIPTVADFIIQTTSEKLSDKLDKRGRISLIDDALRFWENAQSHANQWLKIGALYLLQKECNRWLKLKVDKEKPTTIFITRYSLITALKTAALEKLQEIEPNLAEALDKYEKRKREFGAYQALKGLAGVYAYERDLYLENKKGSGLQGNAFSLTIVEQQVLPGAANFVASQRRHHKKVDKNLKDATETDFADLTLKQVRALEEFAMQNNCLGTTTYLNKILRLSLLAAPGDWGRLWDINGYPIDMNQMKRDIFAEADRLELAPYAMDKYGMLYTAYEQPRKGATRFNHSSFTAGSDVICAGMLHIGGTGMHKQLGRLNCISNNSGHYKPTRANLHQCVSILSAQGVDLTNTRVTCMEVPEGQRHLIDSNYTAATFLNNMNAPPDLLVNPATLDTQFG